MGAPQDQEIDHGPRAILLATPLFQAPPTSDRNSPATAPAPAIVPMASSRPAPPASCSERPDNAPGPIPSVAARSSVHAAPHKLPDARSPHAPRTPWLAPHGPPAPAPNRSS